jgi:hypothetical protein
MSGVAADDKRQARQAGDDTVITIAGGILLAVLVILFFPVLLRISLVAAAIAGFGLLTLLTMVLK